MAAPKVPPAPLLSLALQKIKSFTYIGLAIFISFAASAVAKSWTELNIGPFYVYTDSDESAARDVLAQMEQTRWVLSNLLENLNLQTVWPIRVLVTRAGGTNIQNGFVSQNLNRFRGQHVLVLKPGEKPPLGDLAVLLLQSNTPPLPPEVESGLRQLFDTVEAHGSRVSWGGHPAHPDMAFARMQLFATKFEYGASFHIFLTSLKNGGTLRTAASNAFGHSYADLEKEAADHLHHGAWEEVSVSGRPLDPKRDFGEHSLPAELAAVYLADAQLGSFRKTAETTYKAAAENAQLCGAAGFEGLAQVAVLEGEQPDSYLDNAIRANSRSAPVYLAASIGREPDDALRLAKRAEALNPRWADPLVRQAELTENPATREELLKKAAALDRRQPRIFVELAKAQIANGHANLAAGSWLRAEDAAPTEAERDRVHQLRLDAENGRLDAAEAARQSEIDAAFQADQRAQRSQAARVRAAEQKANKALGAESKIAPPEAPLAWNQLAGEKKAEGTVTKVECLGSNARLYFRDRSGASMKLLWRNVSELGLACGDQNPAVRVSLTYVPVPDESSRTDGAVATFRAWTTR